MPAERASMDEQLILDRYRLIERIASGGSAEVWRAHDEQLDRPVAIKRLHPHLLPDPASRRRLAAEARAVAGLSHPVIVGVYDVDTEGDAPALVMELVEGESLAARISRGGPLTEREAAEVAADVADALYHAHQRGVVHRDVKAGNVLLSTDGRTKLVDFGIAYSLAESAERLTLAGTVIGTLQSMAPEQLAGGPIGPRTDLYGIGVVLHQALTGRAPYPASSPVALAQVQRGEPPALEGIDPALAGLVRACLAHAPDDRPLHAGAISSALRAWLAGDPSGALALVPVAIDTSAITRPAAVLAAANPAAASVPDRGRWRPPRALAPVLALAALVLLVGFMLSGLRDGGGAVADATPTPLATPLPATPAATPAPEWVVKLIDEVARDCDAATVESVRVDIASMGEEEAKEYVEAVREQCKEAREGNGGGNGNEGRGQGGGNDGGGDD